MTDELNPYLERLVTEANNVEQAHAAHFRAEQAMITPSAAAHDQFIRASMVLQLLANGREEYAKNAPEQVRDILLREVSSYRLAAKVLAGNGFSAQSALPSWRWDEFTSQVAELGLTLDFAD